ncbi:MAG: hypothetical protein KAG66_23475, partial [Methylococcales bacterium]|nr:hypothetical protein [Methylococcales bacterium]
MQRILPKNPNQVFKILFFLLPILYFILYGSYGFDETDQGFIVSLCYRILIGEVPHEDFFYVRPPLTPLLHSLEMALLPENIELIGMRFFGILYLWLTVLFSLLAFRRLFDFEQLNISVWHLGALGFIVSMHNYPPMAWHTIDGVLFTALGAYFLSRGEQAHWIALALIAWAMAPLAKQPFAVVPLTGLLAVFWMYPPRKAAKGLALAASIGIILMAFMYFIAPGKEFIQEM